MFSIHLYKIATKVRDFQDKMSSIKAKNVHTRCVQRVQLFPALETTITHIANNVYKQELKMVKKFDHGAVRLSYNKKKSKVGPGQFKLDPYLIKTGALDSVILIK